MNGMSNDKLRLSILAALSFTASGAGFAQGTAPAQTTAAAPDATPSASPSATGSSDASLAGNDNLEEIVVTASGADKTRLRSSITVTDVASQDIQDFTPRSEAEVFRLIPGIRAEDTAGPGGNSNITVRGLPIVTGGSEFVQLQEDGLPGVLFGDMNFGNNDYWLRYDYNVARVEAVQGGSASTLASQAPGAVINYISDTGEKEGGAIALTRAVNYTETRVDFAYGGPISDTVRFHVGGFVKDGNGPTNIGYDAERGYQLKANVTKEINDGKGYIQLNFKRLDDKEPTYTVSPSLATVSGNTIGNFKPFPGFDARNSSNQSVLDQSFQVYNNGQLQTVNTQGIHPVVTAVGGAFHNEFNDNFSVDDKFRVTQQSGQFITQFVTVGTSASVLGSTVNGHTVGSIVYANGNNQGKVFTGTYLNVNPNIDTNMSNMGNWVNDLSMTGKYEYDPVGKITARAGWFHMVQDIAEDWHVNQTYSELSGNNPAMLDLFSGPDGTGTQLTAAGQAGFNNQWGGNARNYDLSYTDDAPYLQLTDNVLGLDLDGSVRFDHVKASGWAYGGVTGPDVTASDNLGTAVLPTEVPGGQEEVLDYLVKYTSWSFGALYALNNDTSIYARASRGGRFNADREILSGYTNPDGSLNAGGKENALNVVEQQEVGIKNRGDLFGATYNVEAVYFRAQTADVNYDLTYNTYYNDVYHSQGVEIDGAVLVFRNFRFDADITYTDATIFKDNTPTSATYVNTTGNVPLATPKFIYRFSPSYDAGIAAVGMSIDGQSAAFTSNDDTFQIEGQTYVNGFAKVRPYEGLEVSLNVNNVFDTLGYRGRGNFFSTGGNTGIIENSAVLGRTISATIKYKF